MRTPTKLIAPLLLITALTAACTGGGSGGESPTPGQSSHTPSPTQSVATTFTPGSFKYSNGGLVVTLELKTNTGTMVVDNGSGHDLGKPDLYVIDGNDGHRIDGKVTNGKPLADGASATFQVQFPPEVNDKELGLVVLLFGPDNYGAFAPN